MATDFAKFKEDRNKKIVLIFTPSHGNLGDSAITLGELEFFKERFKDYSVYEFTKNETLFYKNQIKDHITDKDIIAFHGGGFLGSIWKADNNYFLKIIKLFSDNKIVVMPQTIYFYEDDDKLKESFVIGTSLCRDLTILCRDYQSYQTLKDLKVRCKFEYVPDIALYCQPNLNLERNNKILLCFRSDREKVSRHSGIMRLLHDLEIKFDRTDMVIPRIITKKGRYSTVMKKFEQFARYRMVITDRLHAMIFSTITNTPCIAFDNVSKKVSGVHEWIKDLDYIQIAKGDLTEEMLSKIFNSQHDKAYTSAMLKSEFDKIEKILRGGGVGIVIILNQQIKAQLSGLFLLRY